MKTQFCRPLISQAELDAVISVLLACLEWMAGVLGRRAQPRRTRRLEQWVRRLERYTECTLFLRAATLMDWRRRAQTCVGLRPGFRLALSNCRLLMKSARVRLRHANPLDRVLRLLDALARPARYLGRFMRRLARASCLVSLVATHPPARLLFGAIAAPMPALADSS